MSFRVNGGYIQPPGNGKTSKDINGINQNRNAFQNLLDLEIQKTKGDIKVSSHASKRLAQRNISLSEKDLEALGDAMDRAKTKGARESLMLYKDMAFIASIRNRTLITAMDPKDTKENIFTNIDSAVIVE